MVLDGAICPSSDWADVHCGDVAARNALGITEVRSTAADV